MNANQCDIGLIGLAVMGENLALNLESKGFSVAVFNRTTEVTEKFAAGRAKGKNIRPTRTMEEFVAALKKPRIAMMMIKAGKPVDIVIGEIVPLLERGDVLIDGGNSLFTDTQRRDKELEGKGIHFVGMGVSGGEEGALKGPSLMPGGSRESWEIIAPIFRKIAAQVDGEPCCRYMGPDGAGHYVKMVHNGIEYGDIQLICEAYAILKDILEMQAQELADVFAEWNKGELDSYLIEITSEIFRKIDPDTGKPLVDMILDKAGQKGTGLEMDPGYYYAHVDLGQVLAAKRASEAAISEYQKARALNDDPFVLGLLAHAYASSGNKSEALKILEQLKELSKQRYVSAFSFAIVNLGLGDKEQALGWLEQSYQDRAGADIGWIRVDPLFDPLHGDQRFEVLAEKIVPTAEFKSATISK
jgi:6-phosphogluconate dehydrogenase